MSGRENRQSLLLPILLPLVILGVRTGRMRDVGRTAIAATVTWLVVNLPILVLFPRGWSEFFRLNARRGDDMDSLYNVLKSFTGWGGFDQNLGFWEPPTVLNGVSAVLPLDRWLFINPELTVHLRREPRGE